MEDKIIVKSRYNGTYCFHILPDYDTFKDWIAAEIFCSGGEMEYSIVDSLPGDAYLVNMGGDGKHTIAYKEHGGGLWFDEETEEATA